MMQRMKSDTAVRIAYTETRTLELMETSWQGSGYLYSLPPDRMLKAQLAPQRLLMAVEGGRMFYFDPVQGVRRQGEMDADHPLTLNLAVIKALLHRSKSNKPTATTVCSLYTRMPKAQKSRTK